MGRPLPKWGVGVSQTAVSHARLVAATALGAAAGSLSRLSGRGRGVVVTGRTILAVAPGALQQLSAGRYTVLVSGTNGKTTTTAMIAAAMDSAPATNDTGANMDAGVVAAYARSTSSVAVMEVDELYVPTVGAQTAPRLFIALNLSRDHMDRMHEVSAVARTWAHFLEGTDTHVIANSRDPNIVAAVGSQPATWVDPGWELRADCAVCPLCTALLDWGTSGWSCTCGLAEPAADYTVEGDEVRTEQGQRVPLHLSLPGAINRANAAFAIAAAQRIGVDPGTASSRIAELEDVCGRYGTITVGGRRARTLLAKNPAGWASLLPMLDSDDVLIVSVNAREADGFDTSWLWDVPFEALCGRVVGVHGEQQAALALRLQVAGVESIVDADLDGLARRLPAGPCVILANYTAFESLRYRR